MNTKAASFDEVAELYDQIRPGYPAEVFEALKSHASLNEQSRILEVGTGTGQATKSLKRISRYITCIEPGANLLAVAKRNHPDLNFVNTTFEDYETESKFDLILAATAWHWINPAVGYAKARNLLKPGGFFANLRNYHIETDPQAFLNRAEPIFRQFSKSATSPDLSSRHQINEAIESINNQSFHLTYTFEKAWRQTYSIEDYILLRRTYSPHRALPAEERRSLERQLCALANDEFNGRVTQSYLAVLLLAA